jgi:hypothetical protein
MTDRPLAYTATNVLAILHGRKRRTRRIIAGATDGAWLPSGAWVELQGERWMAGNNGVVWELRPYAAVGDRFWIREAWRTGIALDPYNATTIAKRAREAGWSKPWAPVRYEADGATCDWDAIEGFGGKAGRLRAARFMPQWASRIQQGLLSIRAERLQAITVEDIIAEGIDVPRCAYDKVPEDPRVLDQERECWARARFQELWDGINGDRPGCAWLDNPFVWVLETDTIGR